MALRRTLEALKLGERVNDELYRSTTDRTRIERLRWRPSPLDPWRRLREITLAAG